LMSNVHLRAVLPQIHRLFSFGVAAGLSDSALVHRFCVGNDESAFAVLMARHGPMVLGVCRNILRDESDAEDAFQSVFLVLVRRARSIRVEESLGGWLHGVAHRVALRANARAVQRRARERTGTLVEAVDTRNEPAADPRFAILHEEIARLSAAHRQALVLCMLEGKTQVEAAQEIGCGEATVRRRLAQAQERLRARLERRDLGPIVPASLPAVPPALVEATTRAAAGPLKTLAASVVREMARAQALRAALILLAMGLGTACAGGAAVAVMARDAQVPPSPASPPVQIVISRPQTAPNPIVQAQSLAQQPEGGVSVPGRVVGPDGKLVAGATVFLRSSGVAVPELKAVTDAGGRFRFPTKHELGWKTTPKAPGELVAGPFSDADEIRNLKPRLIAIAPGYGFGLPVDDAELTLKLSADDPIGGRVTNREGQSVAGARVRIRNIYMGKRANGQAASAENPTGSTSEGGRRLEPSAPAASIDRWLDAVRRATYIQEFVDAGTRYLTPLVDSLGDIPAAHAPLVPPVTSDADGRFQLAGIGRDRVAEIIIDGKDLASSLVVAVTRTIDRPIQIPAKAPATKHMLANTWDDLTVFGDQINHVAGTGRVVAGVVTDRATGEPLAGLVVHGPWRSPLEYHEYDRFCATTDGYGRYRIEGLPVPSHGELTVDPPQDRPYFGEKQSIEIKPGDGPLAISVPVRRGVWITGRVVDDATNNAVHGILGYFAFADNRVLRKDLDAGCVPIMRQVHTDNDGKFRIAGYPGRGIVTAWHSDYLTGVGADKVAGLTKEQPSDQLYPSHQFSPEIVSTVIELNVPEARDEIACELRLRKGKSREVQVVGPDGNPQFDTLASGLRNQIENPMTHIAGDRFTVSNLIPGEAREVVAMLVAKKLTGMATVNYDGDGPVILRLQSWATVTGRLVDEQGQPRGQAIEIMLDDGKLPLHTLGGRGYDRPAFPIESDGRFRIEGLVPGPAYGLKALEGGVKITGDVATRLILKPGEARELGDVKVRP
jgi:RNA polymerase sigma factor (sigma-70 family)